MKVVTRLLCAILVFPLPLLLKSQQWTHIPDPQYYNFEELDYPIQEDHPDYFITNGGGLNNLFSREGALEEQSENYLFIRADTLWALDRESNLLFRPIKSRQWRHFRKLNLSPGIQHGIQIRGDRAFIWHLSSYYFYRLSSDSLWEQSFIWKADTLRIETLFFDEVEEALYFSSNKRLFYFKDTVSLLSSYESSGVSLPWNLKKGINGDVYFNFKRGGYLKLRGGRVIDTLSLDSGSLFIVTDWSPGKDVLYVAYRDTSWNFWMQSLGRVNKKSALEQDFRFKAGGKEPCALVERTKLQKWNGNTWIDHEIKSDLHKKYYLGGEDALWIVSRNQLLLYNYQSSEYELIHNFHNAGNLPDVKRLSNGLAVYKGDSLYMFSRSGEVKIHSLDTPYEMVSLNGKHYIQTLGASVYFTLENRGIYKWNWEKGLTKLSDQLGTGIFLPSDSGFYLYNPNSDSLLKLENGKFVFATELGEWNQFFGLATDGTNLIFRKGTGTRYSLNQKGERLMHSDVVCFDSYLDRIRLGYQYLSWLYRIEIVLEDGSELRILTHPNSDLINYDQMSFGEDGRIILQTNGQNGVFFTSANAINSSNIVQIKNKDFNVGIHANGVVGIWNGGYKSGMTNKENELVAGSVSPVLYAQHNEQTFYSSAKYFLQDKSALSPGVSKWHYPSTSVASVITKEILEKSKEKAFFDKLLAWPAVGNPEIYSNDSYAPFEDVNNNGYYDPINGDLPKIFGDESAYLIASDLDRSIERRVGPLDIELHTMAWTVSGSECLDRSLFLRYTIVNRSDRNYDSLMFGLFSFMNEDFDSEGFGSDSLLDARYYFNTKSRGIKSVWGITHLNHRLFRHNYAEYGSFTRVTFPHDNDVPFYLKNYFKGLWSNGDTMKHGDDPVLLYHTGDPVKGPSYTVFDGLGFESARNTFGSSPFLSLGVGERKHLDYAIHWVDSDTGTNITNINLFRDCARELKEEYRLMDLSYSGANVAHPNPHRVDIDEYVEENPDLIVYPNPSGGFVKFSNLNWRLMSVLNSQGQAVDFMVNNNEIELNRLRSGLYNLVFKHQNGQWRTKRILIK